MVDAYALTCRIVETLPIGYYLGSNLPVEVNKNGKDTYYDLKNKIISIGYAGSVKKLLKTGHVNDSNIEELIRTQLYHELSHVLDTPQSIFDGLCDQERDIVNTFCDERIETKFRTKYENCDFDKWIKILCDYDPALGIPNYNEGKFFWCVRFNHGAPEHVKLKEYYLNKWLHKINKMSLSYDVNSYIKDIIHLYEIITGDVVMTAREKEIVESNLDFSTANNEEDDTIESFGRWLDIVNNPGDPTYNKALGDIMINFNKKLSLGRSGVTAYSGRINSKNVSRLNRVKATNNYRYFDHKNSNGTQCRSGEVLLNLFIDCSGSFYSNVEACNRFLDSLLKLESDYKNFKFNLVKCTTSFRLAKESDRHVQAKGSNALNESDMVVFKKLQDNSKNCYNIVMFDGTCCTYDQEQYGAMFNKENVAIITEPSNEFFLRVAPKAKVIVTDNYFNEFKANVLKILQRIK